MQAFRCIWRLPISGTRTQLAPHRTHEHENGFEALLAIDYVEFQLALLFPLTENDGWQRIVAQDAVDQPCTVPELPNCFRLRIRLQIQVALMVKTAQIQNASWNQVVRDVSCFIQGLPLKTACGCLGGLFLRRRVQVLAQNKERAE